MNELPVAEPRTLFADDPSARKLVLPWRRTFEMCAQSIKNRRGRFLLVFVSIGVVVAFFVSTLVYHDILGSLRADPDVKTKAALERAGLLSNDPDADARQRERMTLLLVLSGMLCFVGVTNTIFMSVTERFREIGTLKCLGALDSFVVRLFLIESAFIGIVGSALGALVGSLLTWMQLGMSIGFRRLPAGLLFEALAVAGPLAVVGGTLLTLLAAVYPTWIAARMKPVEAMRVEV